MEGYGAMRTHEEFSLAEPLTREQQAAQLRNQFPVSAESMDLMRELFGAGVEMQSMTEGDNHFERKNHRPDNTYQHVIDGETFLSMGRLIEAEKELAKWKAANAKR